MFYTYIAINFCKKTYRARCSITRGDAVESAQLFILLKAERIMTQIREYAQLRVECYAFLMTLSPAPPRHRGNSIQIARAMEIKKKKKQADQKEKTVF